MTAAEIASLCDHIASRRQLIVDTTSSSGGAMAALERPGRAVIAATKSGTEKNATVFARYFVEAFQDPSADTDKSDSVSAMEAFIYAARKTADFYDSQKRLATEHAVFNDKGSGDAVREPGEGEGELLASFTLLRYGNGEQAFNDPGQARAARTEGLARAEDRHAQVPKGGDGSRGLQEATDGCARRARQSAGAAGRRRRRNEATWRRLRACARLVDDRGRARRSLPPCPANCWSLRKHGAAARAQDCFDALSRSNNAYDRAEGFWGLEDWEQANAQFRLAANSPDSSALYKVRWGMLLHERFNDSDAEGLFHEALAKDPSNAEAYVGLAIVSSDGFDGHASDYAAKAIELDPKLAEAHELHGRPRSRQRRSRSGRRGGRQGDRTRRRCARRHGDSCRRRAARRSLARCVVRKNRGHQLPATARRTRASPISLSFTIATKMP